MKLLNYSLDNLSLMALTLAIGFVVGRRHRDARETWCVQHGNGQPRLQAAPRAPARSASPSFHDAFRWRRVLIRLIFLGGVVAAFPRNSP